MSEKIRSLVRKASIAYPGASAPLRHQKFDHATIAALATVLAAGYFNDWRSTLEPGDTIDVTYGLGTSPGRVELAVLTVPATGNVTVGYEETGGRAVVPTSGGLTTGLLEHSDRFVTATSANADHILTLPLASAATLGNVILIWVVPSTNCELRTPADSNQTINGVDSDGTQEALLAHSHLYRCTQHLATGWLMEKLTALGAVATAVVPD